MATLSRIQSLTTRPSSPYPLSNREEYLIDRLKLDNGVEEVLQILVRLSEDKGKPGDRKKDNRDELCAHADGSNISSFDLEKKTEEGDTLLHRVVHATKRHPEDMDLYMQLVDIITKASESWWKTSPSNESRDNQADKRRYKAMNHLLRKVIDGDDRSVWTLTFQLVSVDMIKKLLFLEGVTYFKKSDGKILFVVDMFTTPLDITMNNIITNACAFYCCMHQFEEGFGTLLQKAKHTDKLVDILRIKPIYKIIEMYSSISTKLYVMIVLLHILYMSIFSYAGCDLVDSTKSQTSVSTKGLLYSIGLIEPILLSFYLINDALRCVGVLLVDDDVNKSDYIKRFTVRFLTVLVYTILLCQTISKVDSEIYPIDRNVLSAALLLGWLLTFALANGIESIHFFFKLVMEVMATDVLKILLVYVIFLIGFSLSIHAQFVSSSNITSTYKTPIHTMFLMFNVMMGMEEAVGDSTEEYLEAASASPLFCKLLYIGYILCCSIVLLNLLIAMMNTSYSRIRHQHSYEWLCEAAHFGNKVSEYFPFLARHLGVKYVKFDCILDDEEEKTWHIVMDEEVLEENDINLLTPSNTDLDLRKVDTEIQYSAKRLRNEIRNAQNEIMKCIKELQIDISKLKGSSAKVAWEEQEEQIASKSSLETKKH